MNLYEEEEKKTEFRIHSGKDKNKNGNAKKSSGKYTL